MARTRTFPPGCLRRLAHPGGCRLDVLTDSEVGAAAADVFDGVDVGVAWILVVGEEGCCGHDLTCLAVPALGDVVVEPRLLHGVQGGPICEPFYGRDRVPGDGGDGNVSRVEGVAVEVAGA